MHFIAHQIFNRRHLLEQHEGRNTYHQSETPKNIFLIGGDFNLPDINWSEQTITNRQYPIKTNLAFLGIVADEGLEQIVDFPTRKDNTLDLMLTSHPAFKLRCKLHCHL